jgi:asparagine synthase (glutamine-hydrolysing)
MKDAGAHAVLSGHGGDEVVSHGRVYLKELALAGRWAALARELFSMPSEETERVPVRLYLHLLLGGLEHRVRRVPALGWTGRILRRMRPRVGSGSDSRGRRPDAWVDPGLAGDVDLTARLAEFSRRYEAAALTVRQRDYQVLTNPMQPEALETLYHISAGSGIEERTPFWDRRLVEFCLALPPQYKRRHGQGRYILRSALRDALPEIVRLRTDKARFEANLRFGLFRNERQRLDEVRSNLDRLSGLANVDQVREALAANRLESDAEACFLLLRAGALLVWLDGHHANPA